MKIRVQESGNTYEVFAFTQRGALKMLAALRTTQRSEPEPEPEPEPEAEAPKMVGTGSIMSGAVDRDYEYGEKSRHADMPIVFGFRPNGERS